LLHGLGATAAVWHGVQRALERSALGRWIAPDLGGHGSSGAEVTYSVGQLAAGIATALPGTRDLFVVGHSLGAYVEELNIHSPEVVEIAGAGHNAHVEKPDAIVSLLKRLVPNV